MNDPRSARRAAVGLGALALALLLGLGLRCRGGRPAGRPAATRSTPTARPVTANAAQPTARGLSRGSVAGTVRSEAGAPIAGARVCADAHADDLAPALVDEPRCADTDTAGHYAIRELFAAHYSIEASAPTYRPGRYHEPEPRLDLELVLAPGQQRTAIDLVLAPGGIQLTGIVNDISGGPIAHARVSASDVLGVSGATAETDARGAFTLWTSPGPVKVEAAAEGYQTNVAAGSAPGAIVVELEPASTLAGIVVDAATRQPLDGALVIAGNARDITGPDGKFRLTGLSADRYEPEASTSHGHGRAASVRVELGGHVEGIVIELAPTLRITGKVMIAGSPPRPCPDPSATIKREVDDTALKREGDETALERTVDGTLEARGLASGTYQLVAECAGYLAAPPDEIVLRDRDVLDRAWLVSPGATLEGRVVTRAGIPVANVDVLANDNAPVYTARADARGHYAFHGLPAGSYGLDASLDGAWMNLPDEVALAAGATVEHDVVLEDLGAVHVVAVDTRGKPVTRRELALQNDIISGTSPIGFRMDAVTNEAGEATFPRVPAGKHWLQELENVIVVQAGRTTEFRLVLPARTASIRGVVVGPDGAPVGDAYVTIEARNGLKPRPPLLTHPDGTFAFTELEAAPLTVSARDGTGRSARQEEVAPGSTVQLQLVASASLAVTIAHAPEHVKIDLGGAADTTRDATLDGNGTVAFTDLPVGHYTLTANAKEGRNTVELDLGPGEHKQLALVFGSFLTITARVVDARTRAPVLGLAVTVRQPGEHGIEEQTAVSDATGRVSFSRIAPGRIELAAYRQREHDVIAVGTELVVTAATSEIGELVAYRAELDHWGDIGLDLRLEEGYCRGMVFEVEPGGPAAAAGLALGDELTAIDGISFTGGRCLITLALLHGPPGKPITLTRADGSSVTVVPVAHPPPEP